MAVEGDQVREIARLAYLENPAGEPQLLSDEALARLAQELNQVLDYVEELKALDVDGVAPTTHGVPVPTRFRDDTANSRFDPRKALDGAPEVEAGGFRVPKVVK